MTEQLGSQRKSASQVRRVKRLLHPDLEEAPRRSSLGPWARKRKVQLANPVIRRAVIGRNAFPNLSDTSHVWRAHQRPDPLSLFSSPSSFISIFLSPQKIFPKTANPLLSRYYSSKDFSHILNFTSSYSDTMAGFADGKLPLS
jgi:hypothetical protein